MIKKIYKFISSKINLIIIDRSERDFIMHNKALFKNSQKELNQILIEVHNMQPNYMAISHFSKILSQIHNAQLVGVAITNISLLYFFNELFIFK